MACDNKPMTLTEWFALKDEQPEPVTVGMVYNTKGRSLPYREDGELVVVPAEDAMTAHDVPRRRELAQPIRRTS